MDQKAVLNIVERFRQALKTKGILSGQIVLYGSYARDDAVWGSDIDLVVISNDFLNKTFWERIDILSDAIFEVMEPIEATAMTPEEWEYGESMICEFARDGRMLAV